MARSSVGFKPILRFIAMSDIHYKDEHTVERDRFELALKTTYAYADESDAYKRLDAICVVGDFADKGTELQMQAFKASLDKYIRPETTLVISYASHEFSDSGMEGATEKLKRIFGKDPDVHEVINGFHFISLSTSDSETSKRCGYNAAKRAWFREQCEKASADTPEKPIFMFQHPHPKDTVYGCINWGNGDLYTVQKDYPALVTFSGHSHAPINDPRSIHQRDFTSLGCGTLSYFELDEFDKVYGTLPPDRENAAQFYIVEADAAGRVRVLLYDLITKRFFPEEWLIEKPWDKSTFIYNDSRPGSECVPYFSEGDKLSITEVCDGGCTLTFPQAKIDKFNVDSYYMTVYDAASGAEVKKVSIWSEYYFLDMPKTMTWRIDGLEAGKEYRVEVYAASFWNKYSKERLKGSFKL
jgi:hypothetical protein